MDEISILRETFDPEAAPSAAGQQRARVALQGRIEAAGRNAKPVTARRRLRIPIAAGLVTATAAVVTAFAVTTGGTGAVPAPVTPNAPKSTEPAVVAAPPFLRPVSAAQYLENAAWSAEQEQWVNPDPEQFMYVETLELSNKKSYQDKYPNGALLPGRTENRKTQIWMRIDGKEMARLDKGKLVVQRQGQGGGYWAQLPWSQITKLTTPAKVRAFVDHPDGPVGMEPSAMAGQYVLPPNVKAAVFRYLAQLPGTKLNPKAVNLDGRPAIGLGLILEGYLSQELLFDKETYALIGERLIAIANHTNHALDGTTHTKKGDLFRQVIYRKMIIVDKAGDTN